MLYATTRSDHDTFTAQRALKEGCAPDGGFYVPMQAVNYTPQELDGLVSLSNSGIIAAVLNRFFNCKLTAIDVDFFLGRHIFKLASFSHTITVAELWRNPDGDFRRIQRILTEKIAVDKSVVCVGEWMKIACTIAMIFCVYAQMLRDGVIKREDKFDIAVPSGTFSGPMAAVYARQMGLPVENIICCCNENSAAWDLLRYGQMKTRQPVRRTLTPRCDVALPDGIERLIRHKLGLNEVHRYVRACKNGDDYHLNEEQHDLLRQGLYAYVVSDKRIPRVIANTYATNQYVLCPYSSLVYSGLMDYRSSTGKNNAAVMLCETSPLQCEDDIAKAMNISVSELYERLNMA